MSVWESLNGLDALGEDRDDPGDFLRRLRVRLVPDYPHDRLGPAYDSEVGVIIHSAKHIFGGSGDSDLQFKFDFSGCDSNELSYVY